MSDRAFSRGHGHLLPKPWPGSGSNVITADPLAAKLRLRVHARVRTRPKHKNGTETAPNLICSLSVTAVQTWLAPIKSGQFHGVSSQHGMGSPCNRRESSVRHGAAHNLGAP